MASSKLCSEMALISVTRATDAMAMSFRRVPLTARRYPGGSRLTRREATPGAPAWPTRRRASGFRPSVSAQREPGPRSPDTGARRTPPPTKHCDRSHEPREEHHGTQRQNSRERRGCRQRSAPMQTKRLSIGDDYWIEDEGGDRAFKVD